MTIAAASPVSTDSARGGLPRSLVVADVGGTFARLALAETQPGQAPLLGSHRTYACAEHPSLAAILADFTAGLGQPVQAAVVAIAGLLDGDVLINSNLPWTVSLSATRVQSGLHELQLINDFEAVALAIPYLQPDTLVPLNGDADPAQAFPALVLGAGTGLGAALRFADGERPVLASEIGKQRSVPLILSQDTDIARVLAAPDADALRRTDERLAQLAGETGASVIYLIDAAGDTVAASNYAQADSFVGNNYAFRDYFQRAMRQGAGEQYGLGTVSRRPGLYLSRRVDGADGRALGVVVVKVELNSVEQTWAASGRPTFVDDGRGVVLATSVPDWRFRALRALAPEEAQAIRDSIQFADAGLQPLDMTGMAGTADDGLVTVDAGSGMQAHVEATLPLQDNPAEWRIHVLVPAAAALAQSQLYWRGVTALALALAFGTLFFLYRRRRWAAERRADMVRTAAVLEQRVNERTAELSAANLRLETEITERESVEARVLRLRDGLVEAEDRRERAAS